MKKKPEAPKATPLDIELSAIGPLAKQIVKVLATNGGEMEHMSIVRQLPPCTDKALAEAFGQCRVSHLLYDVWPTYQLPFHMWKITPYYLPLLRANLGALDA